MKRLPDNTADFPKLIKNNCVYVDKTEQLYHLLTGSGDNFFLSRPRRFGKTLLISTLEQIFLGRRELFEGLWISQSDYTWPKHPVLRISLVEMGVSSPEEFEDRLVRHLKKKAAEAGVHLERNLSSAECLAALVEGLAKQNSVVLLIDEYDAPILAHIENPLLAEAIRAVLKSFYGVIKALDSHLRFVFLTGVTKFNKTSIFSGLNNLLDLTLDDRSATLLGLTLEELQNFFADHIRKAIDQGTLSRVDFMQSMQDWYNGYRFSPYLPTRVYNPCSVIRCLLSGRFENHWSQTGTPSFLVKLVQEKNYPILDLENLVLSDEDLGTFDLDRVQLPALLFQTGCLTIQDYDPETALYTLRFPNQEVTQSMMRILAPLFTSPIEKATCRMR
ncbi:MAG: AAA family ATPase [Myxococcaceae bacterium]|nr:AAA family ATPase [Myxococcaceae bacterium]MBH2005951.1 AAA family ATPase [Myxococcaceae bacterium]